MNTLKVGLELEDNQFKESVQRDKQAFNDIGKAAQEAGKDLNSYVKDFKKISQASIQEYRNLQKQYTALTIAYRQMSEEEQKSAKGQELAAKLDELREKAAFFADAIGDARAEISQMSSDTVYWDGLSDAINLTKNGLQSFLSITGLCDTESESFKNTLAQLVKVETSAKFVITAINAVQKQSKIMTALTTAQTAAHTVAVKLNTSAQSKNIIVTKAATAALRVFNAVAKANPYVLLATAIIGVSTALIGFIKHSNDAAKAEENAKKATEKEKKAFEEAKQATEKWNKSIADNAAKSIVQYNKLQREYLNLSSTLKKTEFIKDNKKAFDELGISINNINDAEKYLINNSEDIIKAFKLRAEAAAWASKAEDDFAKSIEKRAELEAQSRFREVHEGDRAAHTDANGNTSLPSWALDSRYTTEPSPGNPRRWTREGAEKENANRRAELEREVAQYTEQANKALDKEIELLLKAAELGVKVGKNNKEVTLEQLEGLSKLQDELKKLEKEKEDIPLKIDLNTEEGKKKLADLDKKITDKKAEIEKRKIELGLETAKDPLDEAVELYEKAQKKCDDIKKKYDLGLIDENTAKQQLESIQKSIEHLNMKPLDLKLKEPKQSPLAGSLKAIEEEISKLQLTINYNPTDSKEYEDAIKQLNILTKQKQVVEAKIKLDTTDAQEAYKEWTKSIIEYNNAQYDSVKTVYSGVTGLIDSVKSLGESWDEMDGWEQLEGVADTIFGIIDSFLQMNDAIAKVTEMFTAMTEAETIATATKEANTVATEAHTAAKELEAGAVESEAAVEIQADMSTATAAVQSNIAKLTSAEFASLANQMLTSTENTAAYASIPFAGPALAAAAQAIYTGLWASAAIPMFANGGIVPGGSYTGDSTAALLNANEMVLNTGQLARLFRLLNGELGGNASGNPSGEVEFKIKGSELVGVLHNYNKKLGKVL